MFELDKMYCQVIILIILDDKMTHKRPHKLMLCKDNFAIVYHLIYITEYMHDCLQNIMKNI